MPSEESTSSMWSREQDIQFEKAIATYPEDCSDTWEKIAADLPGKSIEEIKHHYELLLDDVISIESGVVPLPSYHSSSDGPISHGSEEKSGKKGNSFGHVNGDCTNGGKPSKLDQERRKGIAWTEDEHRFFLLGLEKYGKGDWRSISRNFVVTRTPTQVASHAQKYFIRLNSMNKDRRRSSIHDITSANGGDGDGSVQQGPVAGQANGSMANPSNKSNKSPTAQVVPAASPGGGIYAAPMVSAVGTPVHMPPPPHLGFRVGEPPLVAPGGPLRYPLPHTSTRR